METVLEKDEKAMDMFDKKLSEADAAIKNGARFYTREEADKVIDSFIMNKKNNKRVFNTLKGKCTLEFADDYKMTDEELISF